MKKTLLFTLVFGIVSTAFSQSFSEKAEEGTLKSYKVFEDTPEIDTMTTIESIQASGIDNLDQTQTVVSETITIIKGLEDEDVHHYEHYKKLEKSFKTVAMLVASEPYTSF